jgi:hypothetical protein
MLHRCEQSLGVRALVRITEDISCSKLLPLALVFALTRRFTRPFRIFFTMDQRSIVLSFHFYLKQLSVMRSIMIL